VSVPPGRLGGHLISRGALHCTGQSQCSQRDYCNHYCRGGCDVAVTRGTGRILRRWAKASAHGRPSREISNGEDAKCEKESYDRNESDCRRSQLASSASLAFCISVVHSFRDVILNPPRRAGFEPRNLSGVGQDTHYRWFERDYLEPNRGIQSNWLNQGK